MKSLDNIIKLQKTYVDDQRLVLAKALERVAIIVRAQEEMRLQKKREEEAVAIDPANAFTYGAFLKEALKRAKILVRELAIAEAGVAAAREKLAEVFEEQKRYETAEAQRIEEERRLIQKRETMDLDEVGGVNHQRQKKT